MIKSSFKPKPEVVILTHMFDIKPWMSGVSEGLHNIIYPHCFKITHSLSGPVTLKYKNWCNDKKWLPENSEGIIVLNVSLILFTDFHSDSVPKMRVI